MTTKATAAATESSTRQSKSSLALHAIEMLSKFKQQLGLIVLCGGFCLPSLFKIKRADLKAAYSVELIQQTVWLSSIHEYVLYNNVKQPDN